MTKTLHHKTMLQKIRNFLLLKLPASDGRGDSNPATAKTMAEPGFDTDFDKRFGQSAFWVAVILSVPLVFAFIRQTPSLSLSMIEANLSKSLQIESSIYPVLIDQHNPTDPVAGQIRAYSDVTSGGRGGITPKRGFHTMSADDTLFVSLSDAGGDNGSSAPTGSTSDATSESVTASDPTAPGQNRRQSEGQGGEAGRRGKPGSAGSSDNLPTRIPSNYRFQDDFSLRWDMSPVASIATQELAGYKYFRDMMRQIRDSFAPPGLNLAWRDQAGVVISQPIKPQVVKVLFLLNQDGVVSDVRIVSSMGQVPVDEACYRVLQNQDFGVPPPEVFKNGNIFGINFLFPPVYR